MALGRCRMIWEINWYVKWTLGYISYIGIRDGKENGSYYSILGLYRGNGKRTWTVLVKGSGYRVNLPEEYNQTLSSTTLNPKPLNPKP